MFDGVKLKEMRNKKGLTMRELAEKVQTSQSMIAYIENGIKNPGVELCKRLADFFGCTVDELLR